MSIGEILTLVVSVLIILGCFFIIYQQEKLQEETQAGWDETRDALRECKSELNDLEPCPDCPPVTGYNIPLNSNHHFKGTYHYQHTLRRDTHDNPDGRFQALPKLFGYFWRDRNVKTPAQIFFQTDYDAVRIELDSLDGMHGLAFEHYLEAGKRYLIKLTAVNELLNYAPDNGWMGAMVTVDSNTDPVIDQYLNKHTLSNDVSHDYIWVVQPKKSGLCIINGYIEIIHAVFNGAVEFEGFSIEEVKTTDYNDAVILL